MRIRKPFLETITELTKKDDKIILIVGDVGFTFMEAYYTKFPRNFLNCGVMEQTMMGIAAGLAKAGYKPWVYSMINFVTFRPYEQVRNDLGYQNANVKLLGVKGSAAYKFLGFSHNIEEPENGLDEDVRVMENLPNFTTHIPTEESQVADIILEEYARVGPSYIRI